MSARQRAWLESTSGGGETGALCADWAGEEDADGSRDAAADADAEQSAIGEKVQVGRE
ncbi:MAG TPA: hypothetical protein VH372_08255 [Actinospica sp.]|nr:hypothetical protein [Actinospica sp.]